MVKKLFILGFFFALILRFYQFGRVPAGLNRDEASLGYNAYSILKTGRDEYGQKLPLTIKSFGDWKLPGYVYTLIPLVAVFGLNDWVVRLPSALAGLGTIIVIYLLSKKILKQKDCSLFASLMLALLPWHLFFSRAGYEANLALFFFTLGTYFFLKYRLIISSIFLTLTLYTYHTYHLLTPLFVFCLLILFRQQIFKQKKSFYLASLIFLIFSAVIFSKNFSGNLTKVSGISFFNDPVSIHTQIEIPRSKSALRRLIYNKPFIFGKIFFLNYFASFLPKFLVFRGGTHPVHNAPGSGNILLVQYLLFLIGLITLIKRRKEPEFSFLLIWLILSPFASSITKDAPSSVRLTPLIIPFCLTAVLGLKRLNLSTTLKLIILVSFVINLAFFSKSYFSNLPKERALNWGAGYEELIKVLNKSEFQNKKIVMSRPNWSPYIYFLFYNQYDPRQYQDQAVRYPPTADGFEHVKSFARFEFADFEAMSQIKAGKIVVLWHDQLTQEEFVSLSPFLKKTIAFKNQPIFYIFSQDSAFAKN